ncbi:Multidrug resistance ABC transporter ATP-binding and permease protein [Granulibacter bethesdensis CGDNIH4]|nr:Multidrug resistance ABC transporter ATP-binding and permease protein [Granulibacter bethesdensis CGDNIH4]
MLSLQGWSRHSAWLRHCLKDNERVMTVYRDRMGAVAMVLRFLFRHWGRQWRMVLLTALTMMAGTIADLGLPVLSGWLVDAISAAPDAGLRPWDPWTILVMMGLLGALVVGARHVSFVGITALTLRLMEQIAADAFYRVQRFSTDWHANNFAGSIVRKVTRGIWAVDLLNDTLLTSLLPALTILVGSALLLGWYWPGMGLAVGIGAIFYIGLSVALSLLCVAPAARLSNRQDTRMGGAMADAVTCNAVVKAFGAEAREDRVLGRILTKWRQRTRRTWIYGTNSGSAQMLVLLVLRTVIIGYAIVLWSRGQATAGDVTFVMTAYFVVHGYLRDIGQHVANLQRCVNEMEELVEMQSHPLGVEDRPGAVLLRASEGEITFDHVTFRYGSHTTPLFEDFSLRIAAGERVGLVGHSGSGKSSFVKLLQRLYDVTDGRILVDGQDIATVTQSSLRGQMALVPQEAVLFHRSLAENIAYARPGASMEEIMQAARLANADAFIRALPQGYRTMVGERGVKLSGGERQRVAIARAFLADAPVLILDEATASLDSESEALIQQAMERLMAGRTSIVIAHRLSTVRSMDRILVFDHGRIVEEGTHDSLIQREGGLYRRLFERQAMGLVQVMS